MQHDTQGKWMTKLLKTLLMTTLLVAAPAFATTIVTSPANGSTVSSSVQFVATGNTSCTRGVASMGIYVDSKLAYLVNGASLNTTLSLPTGSHNTFVQEWDYCGASTGTPISLNVGQAKSGVYVSSPASASTVSTNVSYVATATSACVKGIASMGVYVNNQLAAVSQGASLNKQLTLSPGKQNTVVQSWDNCGGSATQAVPITVQGGSGTVLSGIQALSGWNSWGELAPVYDICTSAGSCPGVTWGMTQHESSISLSGNATRFDIGGTTPYSDVLWSNPIMGQGATASMQDTGHKLIPTLHNFTYDTYVYVTNVAVTQDLEFDVNMYLDGAGMEWGTECNHLADGDWDIWDNVNAKWVSTGVACNLVNNAWNHVTIQVQRESNNDLLYQTITLNGVTSNINKTYAPFSVSSSWYGMTVNYQMDGNYKQAANTTYLDNFSLTYW
jgi:hypothetical protein